VSLHPQVVQVLRAMEDGSDGSDLAAARAGYLDTALRFGGAAEVVDHVEDGAAGGVRFRLYRPQTPASDGAIVYAHGGGWVLGDLDGIDHVCRALCNAAGAAVVSVDYRLAPEHPFPDAVDDVLTVLDWALGRFERVCVAGDSAGGNLAAAATLARRGLVAGLLLVYPALDPTCSGRSYATEHPGLTKAQMEACWSAYLSGTDPDNPAVCPLGADLVDMPPTFIAVAGHDVLRDDGVAFAGALEEAGVDVELVEYDDMVHGFLRWGGVVDRASELLRELGEVAREQLED
jgi:acetyl esterase